MSKKNLVVLMSCILISFVFNSKAMASNLDGESSDYGFSLDSDDFAKSYWFPIYVDNKIVKNGVIVGINRAYVGVARAKKTTSKKQCRYQIMYLSTMKGNETVLSCSKKLRVESILPTGTDLRGDYPKSQVPQASFTTGVGFGLTGDVSTVGAKFSLSYQTNVVKKALNIVNNSDIDPLKRDKYSVMFSYSPTISSEAREYCMNKSELRGSYVIYSNKLGLTTALFFKPTFNIFNIEYVGEEIKIPMKITTTI